MLNFLVSFFVIIAILAGIMEFYYLYRYFCFGLGKFPPYIPSMGKMKQVALDEARIFLANSDDGLNVADMGCGSAGMLKTLALEFPQHNFVGYEWDSVPYYFGKFFCKKIKNINIYKENFFKVSWAKNDLIICFTCNEMAEKISYKVKNELSQGAKVISLVFHLLDMSNEKVLEARTFYVLPLKVFVYEITK